MINFKIAKEDAALITKIVDRAEGMAMDHGHHFDKQSTSMDLIACHANGCPLRLADLLNADNFNFAHDVFGIEHHINRKTGRLENCFLPRFAVPESEMKPFKPGDMVTVFQKPETDEDEEGTAVLVRCINPSPQPGRECWMVRFCGDGETDMTFQRDVARRNRIVA